MWMMIGRFIIDCKITNFRMEMLPLTDHRCQILWHLGFAVDPTIDSLRAPRPLAVSVDGLGRNERGR